MCDFFWQRERCQRIRIVSLFICLSSLASLCQTTKCRNTHPAQLCETTKVGNSIGGPVQNDKVQKPTLRALPLDKARQPTMSDLAVARPRKPTRRFCTTQYCPVRLCTTLYYPVRLCTTLSYPVRLCTTLYYPVRFCTTLYYRRTPAALHRHPTTPPLATATTAIATTEAHAHAGNPDQQNPHHCHPSLHTLFHWDAVVSSGQVFSVM